MYLLDHLFVTREERRPAIPSKAPITSSPLQSHAETALLYTLFLLTGTAVLLPGILLPLLSRTWHGGDAAAGLFFLCASAGSSCGALLARGRLSNALAAGCTMVAAGAVLLGLRHTSAPLLPISLYGCGLGLSMTSISLLRSRRWPARRIVELARLNLVWALGAGVAPSILLRAATHFNTTLVLRALATLFVVGAALVFLLIPSLSQTGEQAGNWLRSLRRVPPVLLCLIPLTTGVEGGIASWLATYIMRAGYVLNITISATTAFGAGVILSRLLYSRATPAAARTRIILGLHSALIVVGILLLLLSTAPTLSIAAAFLAGFGVGPMYPFVLALLLNHNEAGNAGFLAGGLGASLLPMLIGAVSAWSHSLRLGLVVPLAAAALLGLLSTQGDQSLTDRKRSVERRG